MYKLSMVFKEIFKEYWDLLLYLVAVTIIISNFFEDGILIAGVDANFPLTLNAIDIRIEDFSSLINNAGSGELFNPFPYYTLFPYLYYLKLLGIITNNIHSVQILFFFSYFLFSYVSIRLFFREFFNVNSKPAFFIAGISYAMNPVSDFLFTAYLPEVWLAYCFFPLVFYCLIASAKRHSKVYFVLFLISYHFFIMTMLPNAPYFLVLNVLGLSLFLFYPGINWQTKVKIITITGVCFVAINFLDFYLLYQYFSSSFSGQEHLFSTEKPALNSLQVSSRHSSLLNVLRLMHLSGFHDVFWAEGIAHYSRVFYSLEKIPLILSFVPFLIIVAGFFLDRGRNKVFLNTFILCLLFIFFAKSIKPPFGSLFYTLFENFSFFQIFRSAPEKFGLALAFLISVLLGKSYLILTSSLNFRRVFFLNIFLLVALLYFRLPWLNGDIMTDGKGAMPSFYIKVPEYYSDYEKDMQKEDYKTILNLPSYGRHYLWGLFHWGYFGVNILPQFNANHSILSPAISGSVRSQWLRDIVSYNLGETIQTANKEKVANLLPYLSLLGIKEIVVDTDRVMHHQHYTSPDSKEIRNRIEKLLDGNIREKRIYGDNKIIRYILNDNIFSDEIYLASSRSIFPGLERLKKWERFGFSETSPTKIAILDEDKLLFNNVKFGDGDLNYTRISPSKYTARISKTEGSVLLVFSKEFNSFWKIKSNKKITTKHILVNDYANGWIISPDGDHQSLKDLQITLEFDLQKYSHYRDLFKRSLFLLGLLWIALTLLQNKKLLPQKLFKKSLS
jgi:hypothetical protein